MGNQKFKLSDMIPNAWFYKLKDMSKPSKTTQTKLKKHNRLPPPPAPPSSPPSTTNPPPQSKPEPQCQPRKSYHFTRELYVSSPLEDPPLTPPRKSKSSSKSRKSTRKSTNNNNGCNCRTTATLQSHRPKTASVMGETNVKDVGFPPEAENVSPIKKAEHLDIVIDVDNYKYRVPSSQLGSAQLLESLSAQSYKINGFDFHLPRIITKPSRSPKSENSTKELDTEKLPMVPLAPSSRRFSVSSPAGVRLKINSPKIMARKQGQNGNFGGRKSVKKRRSISESFAVVKSSDDPQRDFKESMVEMILQNNLRASKDLEDLLACYLSLNSDEYHDVIIKVFKQIWFDLSDLKHKKFVP